MCKIIEDLVKMESAEIIAEAEEAKKAAAEAEAKAKRAAAEAAAATEATTIQLASRLLAKGIVPIADISEYTGLSEERLQEIAKAIA